MQGAGRPTGRRISQCWPMLEGLSWRGACGSAAGWRVERAYARQLVSYPVVPDRSFAAPGWSRTRPGRPTSLPRCLPPATEASLMAGRSTRSTSGLRVHRPTRSGGRLPGDQGQPPAVRHSPEGPPGAWLCVLCQTRQCSREQLAGNLRLGHARLRRGARPRRTYRRAGSAARLHSRAARANSFARGSSSSRASIRRWTDSGCSRAVRRCSRSLITPILTPAESASCRWLNPAAWRYSLISSAACRCTIGARSADGIGSN